jgi:quinoprotein glucose dehydrogenase
MKLSKVLFALGFAGLSGVAMAQVGKSASTGVYSKAQAERGQALYAQQCAGCHGPALAGADVNPPLSGPRFLGNWQGQPVAALTGMIRTNMPADNPGALGLSATADVTAYILSQNGYPAGEADMPTSSSAQNELQIDPPPASK